MLLGTPILRPGAIAVYRNSLKRWDPPDDEQVLADSDRERIMGNIRLAFTSLGYEAHVIPDWTPSAD
jgi:Immunity protein 74